MLLPSQDITNDKTTVVQVMRRQALHGSMLTQVHVAIWSEFIMSCLNLGYG